MKTMKNKIEIKKIIKLKNQNDLEYIECNYLLNINDKFFNVEEDYGYSKHLCDILTDQYYNFIENLCIDKHVLLVRISEYSLHELVEKYTLSSEGRNHVIFHYHHWNIDDCDGMDEQSYMLIKCDKVLLKELFNIYWFSVDYEYTFQGIIIKTDNIPHIEEWGRIIDDENGLINIIDRSLLIFDNLRKGLHFRVITNKKQLVNENIFDFVLNINCEGKRGSHLDL